MSIDHKGAAHRGQRLPCPFTPLQANFELGPDEFSQILRGVEWMDMKAFAQFTRQLTQVLVDPSNVNWNLGLLDGAGVEKRGHQRQFEELTAKIERRSGLPTVPDGAQGENILTQPRRRVIPRHAKAALDVRFHLGAQAEDKAPVAEPL